MATPDTIQIRKAILSDSRRIWEIRNNPDMRKISHDSSPIPFQKHDVWFKKQYFLNDQNHCFIAEYNSRVVGYCRYDFVPAGNHLLVSIAIDPNEQGKGIGNALLKNTLSSFPPDKKIRAEIHIGNTPSLKLFQKNNFTIYKTDQSSCYMKFLRKK